jgi:hypothetical protein
MSLLEQISNNIDSKVPSQIHCDKHPEKPIELACLECHTLICHECEYLDHKNHRHQTRKFLHPDEPYKEYVDNVMHEFHLIKSKIA